MVYPYGPRGLYDEPPLKVIGNELDGGGHCRHQGRGGSGMLLLFFVFYGCVVVRRTLALLGTFSCSHKTKNKGTLILAIYQLSCEMIG